jgi:hypothetical protein
LGTRAGWRKTLQRVFRRRGEIEDSAAPIPQTALLPNRIQRFEISYVYFFVVTMNLKEVQVAVKKVAKRAVRQAVARKVNCEGQRWTKERPGMTLRLPLDLREAITEESRVKGDLARIVLYALSHVDHNKVDIQQTRKAGMELTNPQLLHVGAEARAKLKEWAEAEGVSVNAIVVSVLDEFFKRLKKSSALRKELRQELRLHRGFLQS